jgi:hypothetical protein
MKKKNKKSSVVEEVTGIPKLFFKVTNLKKLSYPDELIETDLLKIKVGDYMFKGAGNNIFEVTKIERDSLVESGYKYIYSNIHNLRNNVCTNQLVADLLEKYKKSNNFGYCRIYVKRIIRGGKNVKKGNNISFLEVYQILELGHNIYKLADIDKMIYSKELAEKRLDTSITTLISKKQVHTDFKEALLRLKNKNESTTEAKITVVDSPEKIETSLDYF